ncbi:MAG: response regulator, partial [Flavobacteriaceae bacterium]|nr:response regulator [Flavobacteriaceae bacterium]
MPKVIVADDSQTIQKVVGIYLSNEDYELIKCVDEDTLMPLLEEHGPSLVILDFNLSENKTGYDLAKEIKENSGARVLMLYGTFDTIDEDLFDEAGINAHLVKPFDGSKFVNFCNQLVSDYQMDQEGYDDEDEVEEIRELNKDAFIATSSDVYFDDDDEFELEEVRAEEQTSKFKIDEAAMEANLDDEEIDLENVDVDKLDGTLKFKINEDMMEANLAGEDDDEDEWVVNQPQVEDSSDEQIQEISKHAAITQEELSNLESGMKEWGFSVPGIIGEDLGGAELPPVIGENNLEEIAEQADEFSISEPQTDETIFPNDGDLEYPNLDSSEIEIEFDEIIADSGPTLTSISELADETEEVQEDEDITQSIDLNATLGTDTEEEVQSLEQQIADEVEEDLWSADDITPNTTNIRSDDNINISAAELETRLN